MAESKFKAGDRVRLTYNNAAADPVTLIGPHYADTFSMEIDGWKYVLPSGHETWDRESSMVLVEETEEREFEIDISELRDGDVIVKANIGGSITKHRVRRMVPTLPEPKRGRFVKVVDKDGLIAVVRGGTFGNKWYEYTASTKGERWEDYVKNNNIVEVREINDGE